MKSFRGAAIVLAVLAAAFVVVAPAAARTRVVTPGHSIQRAIDRSDPGDVVVVEEGHYRESLQIDKRLTLRGDDHVLLTPPANPGNSVCNQLAESPGQVTGICIVGQVAVPGGGPPEVVKEVSKVRVGGFTVRGFGGDGVLIFGAGKTLLKRSRLEHNGGYGVFANTSRGTRLVDDVAVGNHAPGLYIGDSPHANAVVRDSVSVGNSGEGILLRSATGGRVIGNELSGNCAGILLLADAPGPAGNWAIEHNHVAHNNRACKGDPGQGEPPLSGIGIAVLGAHDSQVSENRVIGNRALHPSLTSGGIVVGKGVGGTPPRRDLIEQNSAHANTPFDVLWDGSGSVLFRRNECDHSKPSRICH